MTTKTFPHSYKLTSWKTGRVKSDGKASPLRHLRVQRLCRLCGEVVANVLSLSLTLNFAVLFLSNLQVREAVLEAGVWAIGAARSLLCNMTSKISWLGGAAENKEICEDYRALPRWKRVRRKWRLLDVALAYTEAQVENTDGLMILYLIIERWLDLVDAQESKPSLDRLIFSISPMSTCSADVQDLQPKDVLWGALCDAQFWEMENVRSSALDQLSSTCCLLLYVPPEYLTKHVGNFLFGFHGVARIQ
ncbi:hypothetical protein BDR03DRAFT_977033 [Suillus americanus]|nr:hypothetical protein BDR03DRAFT_977033 [Suillus americanus]